MMRPAKRLTFALAIAAAALTASPASAHPAPFTYLDFRFGPGAIEATLVVHIFDLAHDLNIDPPDRLMDAAVTAERADALVALLRPRIRLDMDGGTLAASWSASPPDILADRQSLRLRFNYRLDAPPGSLTVSTLMFAYDGNHQTFINVYENGALTTQAILDRDHTRLGYFTDTRQGVLAAVRKFASAGIHRTLIGADHLLFLIGLLLLGGSLRRTLVVVAAFTAGYSATLALATLSVVSPPARVIQPAIALSIVYVGVDNLLVGGGRDVRVWIALAFGFVHGFGFANVLRELDLPNRARGWSLCSFNVGVEIGQLLVVVAVASAVAALRSRSEAAGRRLALAGSVVVVAAGAFWFIQRVFFAAGTT